MSYIRLSVSVQTYVCLVFYHSDYVGFSALFFFYLSFSFSITFPNEAVNDSFISIFSAWWSWKIELRSANELHARCHCKFLRVLSLSLFRSIFLTHSLCLCLFVCLQHARLLSLSLSRSLSVTHWLSLSLSVCLSLSIYIYIIMDTIQPLLRVHVFFTIFRWEGEKNDLLSIYIVTWKDYFSWDIFA